jgi:hypothetical protein
LLPALLAQVVVHGIDKVLVPQSAQNRTQAAASTGMNNGVSGTTGAGVGDNSAGVSGNVSPNGADADVQASGGDGSRRLMRRLFHMAHLA